MILVGKTFGIGNCIMGIPMIRALHSMGHTVDVLVGTTVDDRGASEIMQMLHEEGVVNAVWHDYVPPYVTAYDECILSIPYDGRWQRGIHFKSKKEPLDQRKRPDNVERLGFNMWKKHEAEYQMDTVRDFFGFKGLTPSSLFFTPPPPSEKRSVFIGIGYKKDPSGFGKTKHWGTENFRKFIEALPKDIDVGSCVAEQDLQDALDIGCLHEEVCDFRRAVKKAASFQAFFGNDTGFSHVMASCDRPVYVMTPYQDLLVKNPPLCKRGKMRLFSHFSSPEDVARDFVDFVWGEE